MVHQDDSGPHSGPPSVEEPPFVTVVMPVRDEERHIERSLGAVLAQDYPGERLEILVADGRSVDRTRERVAELGRGRDVRLIDNPGRIVATGLNAAIREARGEVIVRVDGHCEVPPHYIRRAVELLAEHAADGVAGVGGPIETVGETPLARLIAHAMSSHFGVGGSAFRTGARHAVHADTVPFPAYPRRVLDEAGPYDEELVRNQDDEYNYRLRGAGKKLLLAPELRCRYWSRATLRSLWRQYFQYGFYKVRVMRRHPWQMRPRQLVPPLFVAALGAALLLSPWTAAARLALAGIAGAYGAVNLLATLASWRGVEAPYLPLLPLAFAALHLGYGSGFLWGLVRR